MTLFVATYFIIGLIAALQLGNSEFLFYEIGMVAIMSAVVYVDRRVTFSALVLWMLALWGLLHLTGGLLPIPAHMTEPGDTQVLYNLRLLPGVPKFDQMVHAFGFGASLIAAHEAMQVHFKKKLPLTPPIIAILLLIAMGLGALNEVLEFMAVILIPNTNVGGYENTGWDLVSNMVGAFLAILYLRFMRQRVE